MATKSLAIKYRPKDWDDVSEQNSIKVILTQQLDTNSFKHAYLFCGGAGTGKTTCARIFANKINKGHGNPIEMDAASNNSVDDVRDIIDQSRKKSLDSEYKIFIIDECHMISTAGWNAMLKLIEEPPAMSIFIFCTTDPQKIPKTILSRVQRYDFQRISQEGICRRLVTILQKEQAGESVTSLITMEDDAIEYIAKIADGGMRDAITLMDKCLAYSTELTLENVEKAIGAVDYSTMFNLNCAIFDNNLQDIIGIIEEVHRSGKDLKQFVHSYMLFILDIAKYDCIGSFKYSQIPNSYESEVKDYSDYEYSTCMRLLKCLVDLNSAIKWDASPKAMIEATLIMFAGESVNE